MRQLPPQLYFNIINDVHYQEKLSRLRQKLFWQACGFVFSVILTVLFGRLLWLQIRQSEFLQFLSLIRTDFSLIKNDGNNFILALAESFPVFSGALAAGAILSVLGFTFKSTATAFKMKHLRQHFV
jgi:hypothetical protein